MSSSNLARQLQLRNQSRSLIAPEGQRFVMWRLGPILFICALLAGCGGRGLVDSSLGNSPAGATNSASNAAPLGSPPNSSGNATPISVSAGQNVTGADIVVAAPASATPPNAQDLGVNPVAGLGTAMNTGGSIHRGSTMRILLFGPGLDGNMKVTVAGPPDITISELQSVQATDNTPGIGFTAAVAGNAALGARTVYLKSANGDITSFAGGLEVIP